MELCHISHLRAAPAGTLTIGQIRRLEIARAIMLVEHNVGFVMSNCSRITVLNLGQILAKGTPDEIRTNAAVAEAYLG